MHICKPAADILCDYIDAVSSAKSYEAMNEIREQAILEFRCSYGLSRQEAIIVMAEALVAAFTISEAINAIVPKYATVANTV